MLQYLRPDIIAKPIHSEWCDIIELKLPSPKILTGRENRRSLSAALTEAVSQLREYSSYFDERKWAKIIEDKYGIKCYNPKLVVIIGQNPRKFDEAQDRRALTAYPNLEIVTYDALLNASRNLLLL